MEVFFASIIHPKRIQHGRQRRVPPPLSRARHCGTHREGWRHPDEGNSLFKWSDSGRQGGPAPPEYVRRKVLKAFWRRDRWHAAFTARWSFVPQPLSKFIFKAQSVYRWIRISLIGTVPPCFPPWSLIQLFLITHPFLNHQLSLGVLIYSRMHLFLALVSGGSKAARMASSNTFLRPRW